jgi:hypothetical protein
MDMLLADLELHDALLIAAGLILGFAVINTIHWVMSRRRHVRLPEEFLLEMSRFARRFERSAEQMHRLSELMENPARLSWKARNAEILRTLRQMNRLLQHLNDFFEEKIQDYEVPPARRSETPVQSPQPVGDFSHPEEEEKFKRMSRLTDREIAAADWDSLLDKLADPESNEHPSD